MKTNKSMFARIERAKKAIAKQRDELRSIIEDAETIAESCDEALEALESATDTLSQYL